MVNKKEDKFPRSDTVQGPDIDIEDALGAAWQHHHTSVLRALGVEDPEHGLNKKDIEARRQQYGSNQLEGGDEISIWKIMLHQVANAMTLVSLNLVVPALDSALLQH